MQQILSTLLNDPALAFREEVQSLWSGYGSIRRYFSPAINSTLMVKAVQPDAAAEHPRGWAGETGHQRKLRSYQVERAFYQHFAAHCQSTCRVPRFIAATEWENGFALCMEDLDARGFAGRVEQADDEHVLLVVSWLAHFHATFIKADAPELWPQGCYWHFATRQDEWQAMAPGALKEAAAILDRRLNQARFKTLVHGDAKLANFCFDETQGQVAAVDFQYVGKGVGVRDLAYFLGCCMDSERLQRDAPRWLDIYFTQLRHSLPKSVDGEALEHEWRSLYAIAWADFHRFLAGWMPTHWKINAYMDEMTRQALEVFPQRG